MDQAVKMKMVMLSLASFAFESQEKENKEVYCDAHLEHYCNLFLDMSDVYRQSILSLQQN